jgi:hypothetical protein
MADLHRRIVHHLIDFERNHYVYSYEQLAREVSFDEASWLDSIGVENPWADKAGVCDGRHRHRHHQEG